MKVAFDAHAYLDFFGYENLKVQGPNLMASCLDMDGLHKKGDKHRSFGIHMDTGLANCYVCQTNSRGGGWNLEQLTALLLTYKAKEQGKNYHFNEYDAWRWLEEKEWVPEITPDDFLKQVRRLEERKEIQTYPLEALHPYRKIHKSLLSPQEPNERYFSVDTIKKFNIGYCDVSKRIVIPVFDSLGRLRGVTSRATRPEDFIRYGVGTPNRELYSMANKIEMVMILEKGKVLFGENHFTGRDTLLLVESPLDVVWAHECGLHYVVDIAGMFGATLTQEQERISRGYKRVILAFDNDPAGETGREAAINRLMGYTQIFTFDNFGKKDLGQCNRKEVYNLPNFIEAVTFRTFQNLKPME